MNNTDKTRRELEGTLALLYLHEIDTDEAFDRIVKSTREEVRKALEEVVTESKSNSWSYTGINGKREKAVQISMLELIVDQTNKQLTQGGEGEKS